MDKKSLQGRLIVNSCKKKLAKYKLDLVGVQEVRGDAGVSPNQQVIIHFIWK
jgi:hypothetical protein